METTAIPNWFAYIVLFGWPAICVALFVTLPLDAAAIWSLLGGYLLLPSGLTIDVPLLPPLDKMGITGLSTLILCWMKGTQTPPPRQSICMFVFGACFIIAPIFTSFNNSYELHNANLSIPGFYPVDGLKIAGRNLLILAPLYIGARYLHTDRARGMLLKGLATAILLYSLPMLLEVRISPQLHRLVYGYFPNDNFNQQVRDGGFRPVVFTEHGLALAMLTSLAVLAAILLARTRARVFQMPAGTVATYLGGLLVLCKSLAPIIYVAALTPLMLLTRPRLWVKIACVLSVIVCAYPALRSRGLAPTELVSAASSAISSERSASFDVRVENEKQLLAKANEKPIFGWGTWGRNQIFDPWSGKVTSITDGGWIIQFGIFGWFGYLSLFGLLATAMFRAHGAIGREVTQSSIYLGGLTLLLTVYVVDQIPNADPLSLVLLMAGSIAASPRLRAPAPTVRKVAQPVARNPMAAAS